MKMILYVITSIILAFNSLLTDNPNEIIKKGIGTPYYFQEDIIRLGDVWFYDWQSSNYDNPNYVPMSWEGEDPNLPLDYNSYVLLFNEPDRPEQANISPEQGLIIYKNFREKYPLAKWVVGNVWNSQWLYDFKELCDSDSSCISPTIWGIHFYVIDSQYLYNRFSYLENAHNRLGGTFWITEFASVLGDISTNDKLLQYFESKIWIERYAYFCNRAEGTEIWYPSGWNVQLFDWKTGEPTIIGDWYISGFSKIFLPIIERG